MTIFFPKRFLLLSHVKGFPKDYTETMGQMIMFITLTIIKENN